jgi:hypothetical protein
MDFNPFCFLDCLFFNKDNILKEDEDEIDDDDSIMVYNKHDDDSIMVYNKHDDDSIIKGIPSTDKASNYIHYHNILDLKKDVQFKIVQTYMNSFSTLLHTNDERFKLQLQNWCGTVFEQDVVLEEQVGINNLIENFDIIRQLTDSNSFMYLKSIQSFDVYAGYNKIVINTYAKLHVTISLLYTIFPNIVHNKDIVDKLLCNNFLIIDAIQVFYFNKNNKIFRFSYITEYEKSLYRILSNNDFIFNRITDDSNVTNYGRIIDVSISY